MSCRYTFNFPKIRPDKAGGINAQVFKVMEEANEVEKEVVGLLVAMIRNQPRDYTRLIEETLDLIHAAETMLHVLIDGKAANERQIDRIKGEVIAKNMKRAYYLDGKEVR